MTDKERTYLIRRVEEEARTALNTLRQNLTKEGYEMDLDQEHDKVFQLLRSGKVKLRKKYSESRRCECIRSFFDFSPVEWPEEFDRETYSTQETIILNRKTNLCDRIMLGEGSAEMLQQFMEDLAKILSGVKPHFNRKGKA